VKKDDLVTVTLEENNQASNTFRVYAEIGDEVVLTHPLHPKCMIVKRKDELNKVQPNLKDSIERALEYAVNRQDNLDHNAKGELEALRLYFVVNRSLTNSQKNHLANICGQLASIFFHNDVNIASRCVIENNAVLDSFNLMWFNNFRDLFYGRKPITSPKQRASIFNIAGFVLAELESQRIKK
jgi:hypothetical protein